VASDIQSDPISNQLFGSWFSGKRFESGRRTDSTDSTDSCDNWEKIEKRKCQQLSSSSTAQLARPVVVFDEALF